MTFEQLPQLMSVLWLVRLSVNQCPLEGNPPVGALDVIPCQGQAKVSMVKVTCKLLEGLRSDTCY